MITHTTGTPKYRAPDTPAGQPGLIGVTAKREYDAVEDARGLSCPTPLLRCKRGLGRLDVGKTLLVLATDPESVRDIAAFARQVGHEVVGQDLDNGTHLHYLRKRAATPPSGNAAK